MRAVPAPSSALLRRTALLVLVTFGTVSCFWRAVPITAVESGDEKVEGVRLRLHWPENPQTQEIEVQRLDYPFVEGTDPQAREEPPPTLRFDLREVDEIAVFQPGTGVATTILAVLGTAALVLGIVALVAVMTKQSCPFVYVVGPAGPSLVGEAYSGATSRALQRDDLMPMPALAPGRARMLLANQALEQQYTDRLELAGVEHGPDDHAVATPDARVLLATGGVRADRAVDLAGADVTELVAAADGRAWQTDMEAVSARADPPLRSGIEATFAAPPPGRLLLEVTLSNTWFLDVVTGRFLAAMGVEPEAVQARERAPGWADEVWRWREREGVDLAVEVWRRDGWERAGVIPTVGAAGLRRLAMTLPWDGQGRGEALRVRLVGGPGFWRIDGVALSSLKDASPPVVRVAPTEARDGAGADVAPLLAAVDGRHQVLRRPGEQVALAFDLPGAAPGAVRSWFLLTTGYYLVDPPQRGAPSLRTVERIWDEPGAFRRFGLDLYQQYRAVVVRGSTTAGRP